MKCKFDTEAGRRDGECRGPCSPAAADILPAVFGVGRGEGGEEAGGMVHCRERRAPVNTGLGEEHVGSTVSHYQTELDQVLVYNVREQ